MKKLVVFLVISGLTTMLASGQKTESRSVSGFTGIDASGIFEITIVKGSTESLTIETNDDVMPYVRSEVKNGILRLYLAKNNSKTLKNNTVKVSIVMKNLEKVSLSGACQITSNDLFVSENFTGSCSGSSVMTINVNTGRMNIKASGSSNLQMKANVTGDTKMNFSGSSNIDLNGSAKNLTVNVMGASNFKAEDFVTGTADIKASGSCRVTVHVTEELNVTSSGASTVHHKGSPAITQKSSGSSVIKKI